MNLIKSHKKLSLSDIKSFESKNNVNLSKSYIKFLLHWNGGNPRPNDVFSIDGYGVSVLNVFNGIGDMYDNLSDLIDIYEYRLPEGFIPIGDDPVGNAIVLGTKRIHYDHIYFRDHENESDLDEPDMSNMYFLAGNIWEFLDSLHEDESDEDEV